MTCDVRFDFLSPHNGEYWYKCHTCGAREWFAYYDKPDGKLRKCKAQELQKADTPEPETFLGGLRQANITRQAEWKGSDKVDSLFRATELGEEAGEVLGAVKKLYRDTHNITGNGQKREQYIANLREEIGDLLIVLDLLALEVGRETGETFDLEQCARDKFNATSAKHGMSTKIG